MARRAIGDHSTLILGMAIKATSIPPTTGERLPMIGFYQGGTEQTSINMESSGAIVARRGSISATAYATSSTQFVAGVWYYLELKIVFHGTTGSLSLHVNGVQDTGINLSNVNTITTGNAYADAFRIGGNQYGNAPGMYFDDLYLCDDQGSTNNNFLGDCRVEALFPSGNGNSSQLVGSDSNSTDNYLLVDEADPSTSDYVESSTVGDKDTYTYGNLTPTTGTVYAVQIIPHAAKTDAGTRSIASVARLSSTEVDSADKTLSSTATYLPDIRETKPGGGAWTISDVNSAEFGVKVTA
jgi:hypothetical protein